MATEDGSHSSVVVTTGAQARLAQVPARPREPATGSSLEGIVVPRVAGGIQDDDVVGTVRVSSYWRTMSLPRRAGRLPVHGAAVIARLMWSRSVERHV